MFAFTAYAARAVPDLLARVLLHQAPSGTRTSRAHHDLEGGTTVHDDQVPVPVEDRGQRPRGHQRRRHQLPEETARVFRPTGCRSADIGPEPAATPAAIAKSEAAAAAAAAGAATKTTAAATGTVATATGAGSATATAAAAAATGTAATATGAGSETA